MIVKDLIEVLKGYPQDLDVVVDGYESGSDPIAAVGLVYIVNGERRNEDFEGEYVEYNKALHEGRTVTEKLKISR